MADAMMMFLGEAHGVNWYWAQPGEFENPGVYYWDGAKNVLCVPHLAAAPEAPAVARDKLKVLADEYAAQCSEFARKLASGKPDDSMSPIAVAAGDARMALHLAIDAAPEAPVQADDTDGPMLDGEGWTITLADGHSGPGWYAHCADCPEEGAVFVAAAPEAPAQCDTPRYCASVQRCTADDERRASTPAQASAVDERAEFEAWYSQNAFNFERDPIGSRECGLQWKAWQARAALAQKGGQ